MSVRSDTDVAAVKNNVCILNLDNFVRKYRGIVYESDRFYPNSYISVDNANLIFNIGFNLYTN